MDPGARRALLGDPPRRTGARGPAGEHGIGAGRAMECALRCDQHLGQCGRARGIVGQGQRPLREHRTQLAGADRPRQPVCRARRRIADRVRRRGIAGRARWSPSPPRDGTRHGQRGAGHRGGADRGDRRRAFGFRPETAREGRGGVRIAAGAGEQAVPAPRRNAARCRGRAVPRRLDHKTGDDELPGAAVGAAADQLLLRRPLRRPARARRHRGNGGLRGRRAGWPLRQ